MKSLFGVLSLVIVLVYSQDPKPPACDKTLGPEELHQIEGDWVLQWYLFDNTKTHDDVMPNFSNSHLEIRVDADKHNLDYHERNVYGGGKCATYKMKMTLPQDHQGHHRFNVHTAVEHKDGVEKVWEDVATTEFFPSSHNTMEMLYRSKALGDFLFIYIRDGQHLDLQLNLEEHKARAKCLGLSGDHFEEWHYDRQSDFCHKPSALPTLDSEKLHQVHGDWVLVSMAYDKVKSQEGFLHLASSHVVLRAHSDKHTVSGLERNMIGGKCVVYMFKLTLPEDSQRIHRLDMDGFMRNKDGEVSSITGSYIAEFLHASEDTMRLLYKSKVYGDILATYRRDGHQWEDLQKDREEHKALAKYLAMSEGDFEEWLYDGHSDFCHKPSALPTLGSEELHQVHGDWVLVSMAYDKVKSQEGFKHLASSHVVLRVHSDKHTISVIERNIIGGKCVVYMFKLTLPEDSQRIHRLDMDGFMMNKDGEVSGITGSYTAEFLHASEDTMRLLYKSKAHGDILATYRRDGHQWEDLQKDHEEHKALAKYLSMSEGDFEEWHYDGHSDFCHKTSLGSLPTLGSEELQQVHGHWVLVWVVYDKVKNQGPEEEFTQLTSSHVNVDIHPNKHSLSVSEHNTVGGKCVHYTFQVTLPENSQRNRLDVHEMTRDKDGEVHVVKEPATSEFLPASENEMKLLYKTKNHGNMLAMYRKHGHHQKDLQKDHFMHRALARSLGMIGGDYEVWSYDGVADFCHKKPAPVDS